MENDKVKFELLEGDFETWKSLVPWIEKICENNAGSCLHRLWDAINKTCIVECKFKKSDGYDNAMIEVTNLFSEHGIKEKVIESEDLILKELAEAAGVA